MYNVNSISKFVLSAQCPKKKASAIMNFLVVTIKNLKCVVPNSSKHSDHLYSLKTCLAIYDYKRSN